MPRPTRFSAVPHGLISPNTACARSGVSAQRGATPGASALWGRAMTRTVTALAALSVLAPLLLGPMAATEAWATEAAAEVNVYSYRQPFLIEPIFDRFTEQTGIKVNVVFAPKGLIERLKREGRNSPADLILTSDGGRLHDAVQAGVLQAVSSAVLSANVPAQYRHPDGLWYGLTVRARVIFASKARVAPEELSTYEALTDPRWKGRICMRSSQDDYNVALMASMIAHLGEQQAQAWAEGLLANLARRPQGNDRAQVKAIYGGECDLALVNTYYMGNMLTDPKQKAWAEAVYLFFPNQQGSGQAGRGAHVNISGAGVTAAAPNRDNAVRLLEYLTEDEAQRLYAENNHEYPVKPGVAWSPLVRGWGDFKADPLPLERVAANRAAAVRLFDRIGFP